jgi:threonyl-tRNA synthetase
MLHRAILGSLERFMGILIEHYAGAFPIWMAPVQVKILPIADRHHEYSKTLQKQLQELGVRVNVDERNEKIGYKIREAREQRIPYQFVVGDQEVDAGIVAVRQRGIGDRGAIAIEDIQQEILDAIKNKLIC